MTIVITKIEPITMPVFESGNTTSRITCQPLAPRIARGFEQRAVDAHHRVEDRHDHEERVEMHEREHDGEVRIQQPFERLVDQMRSRAAPD